MINHIIADLNLNYNIFLISNKMKTAPAGKTGAVLVLRWSWWSGELVDKASQNVDCQAKCKANSEGK